MNDIMVICCIIALSLIVHFGFKDINKRIAALEQAQKK